MSDLCSEITWWFPLLRRCAHCTQKWSPHLRSHTKISLLRWLDEKYTQTACHTNNEDHRAKVKLMIKITYKTSNRFCMLNSIKSLLSLFQAPPIWKFLIKSPEISRNYHLCEQRLNRMQLHNILAILWRQWMRISTAPYGQFSFIGKYFRNNCIY